MGAVLGFGVSGPHGQAWFSERKLHRLIAQALDGGVRHFDTAPFYGDAQARLGRALSSLGARDVIVSTKTGTRRAGGRTLKDFSGETIRRDAETSLRRLGRDRLDVFYLHGPSIAQIDAALPALLSLKAEGKIAAIGVCGEGDALDHAVSCGVEAIMGVYNLIDRRHSGVFERARQSGMMRVAIAPLAQGVLARRPAFPIRPAELWRLARSARRAAHPGAVISAAGVDRARSALGRIEGFSPAGAALAFVLHGGLVDVALTTSANPGRLAQSLDAAGRALDPAAFAALSALTLDPAAGQS